jgi:hypothetical protein
MTYTTTSTIEKVVPSLSTWQTVSQIGSLDSQDGFKQFAFPTSSSHLVVRSTMERWSGISGSISTLYQYIELQGRQ